jgi:divalent metal cation (Fe/Co/Zn/Cd) transporter
MAGNMLQTAKMLVVVTILYNLGEGVVAIWSGVQAGSLALIAFGADSYLEVAAAAVVLWRLAVSDPEYGERVEQRAVRFIGWTFLVLALAILYQSSWALANGTGADESVVGIALAIASVMVMPGLAMWKLRTAAQGNIFALAAEAKETLACSYLSLTLLIGLSANAILGWWWLDSMTALLLTPWLIKEGIEGIRGECCAEEVSLHFCRSCFYGLRACPTTGSKAD